MSRHNPQYNLVLALPMFLVLAVPAWGQEKEELPSTASRPGHGQSAAKNEDPMPPTEQITPAIPEGMTIEEVFDYAESPPPEDYPEAIHDDRLYVFTLFEKVEYRASGDNGTSDRFGWEAQGWVGGDVNKFWWKNEGEAVFDGHDEGETETDLLYSRLVTPFWNVQAGAQYANEWNEEEYDDRWSGVITLQGLAPYKFEIDNSLYISEEGDLTFEFEGEYDIRVTQRLVIQPLAGLSLAVQDIPERDLGAGLTDVNLDLRIRYEFKRELAPYIGVRHRFLVGETRGIARTRGEETEQYFIVAGLRFAL